MPLQKTVEPGATAAGLRGDPIRSPNIQTERAIRSDPERDAMRWCCGRPGARPVHFLHVGLRREIVRRNPWIRVKKRRLRERLLGWG